MRAMASLAMPGHSRAMSGNRHPIIYVRGYAMTSAERDETAADPFCGFNVGSTVYRATINKDAPAQKFVFESPIVRLVADYQYQSVYENGLDILDEDWKPSPDETGRDVDGIPARVLARLVLLSRDDPQFRRNRERIVRDAEREGIVLDWDLGLPDDEA